jgi:alginate lyase
VLCSTVCVAQYKVKDDQGTNKVAAVLKQSVLKEAAWALQQLPETVTAAFSVRSAGGRHDFFSEGDYWWPNPASADSPYIQRDGVTNPHNFVAHRQAMIRFSRIVGALASAYILTKDEKYARHAVLHCSAWFVDTATRMNPNLLFAQAIKGRVTGRGIGIIDTIHLMEVVQGLSVFRSATNAYQDQIERIKSWFESYLNWLTTHPYGKDEMNAANNHGTCWVMQVAAFAKFTGNKELLDFCTDRYKTVLLPGQMAPNGSFPLELKRTKPFGYSIFNLDAMTTICQLLSATDNNLWSYEAPGGQSIKKGISWLYPYLEDKKKWPFKQDVMYWDEWPVAQPGLVFGALRFHNDSWFETWRKQDHSPANEEVIRNVPVRNPLIWLHQ